jgi:1-aminocyclopropane-1-carboxylate deaminase
MNFPQAINEAIGLPSLASSKYSIYLKREDLIFPLASGNKWRKLKYNLAAFNDTNANALLTFGGAYSNHLTAVAALGAQQNINTIGIVRGAELAHKPLNPTLIACKQNGMQLIFVSRDEYRLKDRGNTVLELQKKHGALYVLPEGGTNALAVKGCAEILTPQDAVFDTICCAVGTGGTLAGLANSCKAHQHVVGFQMVKDTSIPDRIRTFVPHSNWSLVQHPVYRGYAQVGKPLVAFAHDVLQQTGVLLDPIYTAPMLFQLVHMINDNTWKFGKKLLLIHTGGTQGIAGFNSRSDFQWPEP